MTITPRLIALKDVLARVEKATGADQSLSVVISRAVYPFVKAADRETFILDCINITGSLDACLSLAEHVLPECVWHIVTDFCDYAGASISFDKPFVFYGEDEGGSTPALAFLAAILRALIAVEEKNGVTDDPGQAGS